MGRYYYGDIEGKFWFAVQPSDAADRFGGMYALRYSFGPKCLEAIEEEIKKILDTLGVHKERMDEYFNRGIGYEDSELAEYLGVSAEEVSKLLREYADLGLGIKIRDCIKEYGSCEFDAEV